MSKSAMTPIGVKIQYRNQQHDNQFFKQQGILNIPNVCENLTFTTSDLIDRGEIGRGAYGFVNRMVHSGTQTEIAVKKIRSTLDESEVNNSLKDLDVVVKSVNCPYIVNFYGALFKEGDCWICMEIMSTSLDKFYRFVFNHLHEHIPEVILGKIAVAVISALDYLKSVHNTIHRDVKPSNILINHSGEIKLCDFGISGRLVNSIAKSRDAGCRPYMAPERIDPKSKSGYDVRSDVWSLGITLVELATGKYPYRNFRTVFDMLAVVLEGDPPCLQSQYDFGSFSSDFVNFVNLCLNKKVENRPKYDRLKSDPFFIQAQTTEIMNAGVYFTSVLSRVPDGQELHDFMSKET